MCSKSRKKTKKKRSEKGENKKKKRKKEMMGARDVPEGTVNNSSPVQRGAGFQEWGKDDITFCMQHTGFLASGLAVTHSR